jgi:hypothetical protein
MYLDDPHVTIDKWGIKPIREEEPKMEDYQEIEPTVWKPKESGDETEGILINKRKGQYGGIYCLEWKGKQFVVFGSTVLDDRMNYVKVGEQVKIVYKGLVRNSRGQDTKIFKVYRKEPIKNTTIL